MRKVLLEGLLVAISGGALAFLANAVSPRGLQLTRDFFGSGAEIHAAQISTNSAPASSAEAVAARLKALGFQLADSNHAKALFQDPRYQQGSVVFVDARDDEHYQKGHIPGAYQLDYYHPEKTLGTVLPLCQNAEVIVVYCNGGQCEDSEFTAKFLTSAGINAGKLMVYIGGIMEWATNGLPIELGERGSGQMQEATK